LVSNLSTFSRFPSLDLSEVVGSVVCMTLMPGEQGPSMEGMMISPTVPPANKSSLQLMACLTESEIENKKNKLLFVTFYDKR